LDLRAKAFVKPNFTSESVSNHNQSYLSPISNPSKKIID
jgi:hypothetical protein